MWGKKTRDRLARIEQALAGIAATLVKHADALNLDTPGGLAVVHSEAKDARTAAESAFVAAQALAAVAVKRPDPAEMAKAVAENTELTQRVHAIVSAAPPAVHPGSPGGSAGTGGGTAPRGKGARGEGS